MYTPANKTARNSEHTFQIPKIYSRSRYSSIPDKCKVHSCPRPPDFHKDETVNSINFPGGSVQRPHVFNTCFIIIDIKMRTSVFPQELETRRCKSKYEQKKKLKSHTSDAKNRGVVIVGRDVAQYTLRTPRHLILV